ncbi:MAG: hypothetical protein Q7K55_05960 [Candidatus Levybacteria bacterium]|nr:hypothetical protein [Candidatus Levybacteria bacterium]
MDIEREKSAADQLGEDIVMKSDKSDIVRDVLLGHGTVGERLVDIFVMSLACGERIDMATRAALNRETFTIDRESRDRRKLVEEGLIKGNPDVYDPLVENNNIWALGNLIAFDYLNYTITGEREKMIEEAQVIYLLAALSLGSLERTKKERNARTVSAGIKTKLRIIAQKTAGARKWDELSGIAQEFATSQLAEEIYDVARVWNGDYFNSFNGPGRIVVKLLETYTVINNPDAVMVAARRIYKDIYGIDLRRLNPAE